MSSALLLTGCGKERKKNRRLRRLSWNRSSTIFRRRKKNRKRQKKEPEPDEDTPPEEGMVRSRITNEWVTEDVNNTRPLAIMTPNTKTASHYGISNADVVYECNVEGSITRLMWIIQDWKNADKLGQHQKLPRLLCVLGF